MRVHTKGDPGSGEKLGQEGSKELGKEGSVCEKGPGMRVLRMRKGCENILAVNSIWGVEEGERYLDLLRSGGLWSREEAGAVRVAFATW